MSHPSTHSLSFARTGDGLTVFHIRDEWRTAPGESMSELGSIDAPSCIGAGSVRRAVLHTMRGDTYESVLPSVQWRDAQ